MLESQVGLRVTLGESPFNYSLMSLQEVQSILIFSYTPQMPFRVNSISRISFMQKQQEKNNVTILFMSFITLISIYLYELMVFV